MRDRVGTLVVAIAFGFVLSRTGFSAWDEVHDMFTFSDLRLTLTFGVAVGLLSLVWFLIQRVSSPRWARRPLHRGSVAGGLLFGAGWALTGACPSIVFVQVGEGQLAALFTIVGIVLGNVAFGVLQERVLKWPAVESCSSD